MSCPVCLQDTRPSYERLAEILKAVPGSNSSKTWDERLRAEIQFNQDSLRCVQQILPRTLCFTWRGKWYGEGWCRCEGDGEGQMEGQETAEGRGFSSAPPSLLCFPLTSDLRGSSAIRPVFRLHALLGPAMNR